MDQIEDENEKSQENISENNINPENSAKTINQTSKDNIIEPTSPSKEKETQTVTNKNNVINSNKTIDQSKDHQNGKSNLENKNEQDTDKRVTQASSDDKTNESTNSIVRQNGAKNKNKGKKRPSELELLGVIKTEDLDPYEDKYNVFGDNRQVYRKYKLRKTEQSIDYKEPADLKAEMLPPKNPDTSGPNVIKNQPPDTVICHVCLRDFDSKRALKAHLLWHAAPKEFTCSLCSEKFATNKNLIAHKSIHPPDTYLCTKCKVAFSDYCDFLQHEAIHIKTAQVKCPECSVKYERNYYRAHIENHFDRKFKCHICDYVTNGQIKLSSHISGQHNNHRACIECGKICKSKKTLEYHMVTHTGVKKFQCLYCGKCFASANQAQVHTRIHTKERPYSCEVCSKTFRQSTDLSRHKLKHGPKLFACDYCDKEFWFKDSLDSHLNVHTKEIVFRCSECDAKFYTAAGLKFHCLTKHVKYKPIHCEACNRDFPHKNAFDRHTRQLYHKRNVFGLAMKRDSEV